MQTIGERLEEARKKKGISIREAAEATKIRGDYLSKFESNQFDINLTELYVRGFLRTYATYLKLPSDRILNDYAALGRGESGSNRSRQINREIYGRMDVSVASAEERKESEPAAEEESAPPAPAARRQHSSSPRVRHGGGDAPAGPAIDPALVFKISKWVGAVVLVLLLVWGIKAIFSGSGDHPSSAAISPAGAGAPAASANEPTITLVAVDTVRVTVLRKNPDGTDGPTLFTGTLLRGQTQPVPKPGPLYIVASAAENLQIEVNGQRWPTRQSGYKKMQVQ